MSLNNTNNGKGDQSLKGMKFVETNLQLEVYYVPI